MADYDDIQVEDAPPWLSDLFGVLWNRILGTVKNAVAQAAREAVLCRFPSRAPIDALPDLLDSRNLDPVWNEDERSVRTRIKRVWPTWTEGGRPSSLEDALRLAGFTNLETREQKHDSSLVWWEYEVWLFPPFPFADDYLADGRWDGPGVWDDGGAWAADMTPAMLARVRQALAKWPGLHTRCRSVVVVHAGEAWDASAPPGTWDDDPGATWGDEVSYLSPV